MSSSSDNSSTKPQWQQVEFVQTLLVKRLGGLRQALTELKKHYEDKRDENAQEA